jgi:hypothetical protein
MIYEMQSIKYYSYWDCEQRSMVITDNFHEYITHEMRKRMGGDRNIHLGPKR